MSHILSVGFFFFLVGVDVLSLVAICSSSCWSQFRNSVLTLKDLLGCWWKIYNTGGRDDIYTRLERAKPLLESPKVSIGINFRCYWIEQFTECSIKLRILKTLQVFNWYYSKVTDICSPSIGRQFPIHLFISLLSVSQKEEVMAKYSR